MRCYSGLLAARILQEFPALHRFEDPVSPHIERLLRTPFAAQKIAIMGTVKVDPKRASMKLSGLVLRSLSASRLIESHRDCFPVDGQHGDKSLSRMRLCFPS